MKLDQVHEADDLGKALTKIMKSVIDLYELETPK